MSYNSSHRLKVLKITLVNINLTIIELANSILSTRTCHARAAVTRSDLRTIATKGDGEGSPPTDSLEYLPYTYDMPQSSNSVTCMQIVPMYTV